MSNDASSGRPGPGGISRRATLRLLAGGGVAALSRPVMALSGPGLRTRPIPSSGEALPVVGVGTWQTFDVGTSPEDRLPLEQVLSRFVELGGRVVDSSPMYGRSEAVVGEISAGLRLHRSLFLATKVWTRGRQAGIEQMERSRKLLRAERIDLMQVHNLLDAGTHLPTLRDWKAEGKIRYLGITHYTPGAYGEVARLLKAEKLDFVQINYSLLEREAEEQILPLAADRGVAVIANRPFGGGEAFRRARGKPLPAWAAEFDCRSWAQFFLKWILAHPAVTCAIPGTGKVAHLEDNFQAGTGRLPDAGQRRRMADAVASL